MKNNIFINKYVMACAISIVIALVGYGAVSGYSTSYGDGYHQLQRS